MRVVVKPESGRFRSEPESAIFKVAHQISDPLQLIGFGHIRRSLHQNHQRLHAFYCFFVQRLVFGYI